jgi:hypothetical protein
MPEARCGTTVVRIPGMSISSSDGVDRRSTSRKRTSLSAVSSQREAKPSSSSACDYVHGHITFGDRHARATKTAWEAYAEGNGVCRDYACRLKAARRNLSPGDRRRGDPALSFVAFRRTATLRPWHRAGFRCLCIPFKPSGHILVKAPRSVSDDTSRLRERRG